MTISALLSLSLYLSLFSPQFNTNRPFHNAAHSPRRHLHTHMLAHAHTPAPTPPSLRTIVEDSASRVLLLRFCFWQIIGVNTSTSLSAHRSALPPLLPRLLICLFHQGDDEGLTEIRALEGKVRVTL